MKKLTFILFVLLTIFCLESHAQSKKSYKVGCIGFYNLENLFHPSRDTTINDIEFTPEGANKWTMERYQTKLTQMADVISKVGTDLSPIGVAILGVSEIENRQVLEDLVKEPSIANRNYAIVHYDSPDRRGVDVGLIYQPSVFQVTSSRSTRVYVEDRADFKTRDQLLVSGLFDGELIHVIVNHWPSRSGGEAKSAPLRAAAAKTSRYLVDSLMAVDPQSKIILMGDLNDDPIDESVSKHLGAKGKEKDVKQGGLFNPMWKMYKEGHGTLAYRDAWSLFDQIIISEPLLGTDRSSYKYLRANIFNAKFLTQKSGKYAGYPWRTYAGGVYAGGYSDHFPIYIYIVKEVSK